MGVIDDAAKGLVPPGIDHTLAWRLTVSLSIAGIGVWVFWAMGLLAWAGFSAGLARADEQKQLGDVVAEVQNEVGEVRAALLATEIDSVSTQLCMESFDRELINYRNTLQNQYHEIKKRFHESPPCEILLKLKR